MRRPGPARAARLALLVSVGVNAPSVAHAERASADAQVGYFHLTNARQSAGAVFDGSTGGPTLGVGAGVSLRSRFFVAAGARFFKKNGERVFVADESSPVFRLGHPLEIRIVPVEATIGCRFSRRWSLVPYVGIGGGLVSYREESTVAGVTDRTSETKASAHVVGGAEMGRGRVRWALELGYSIVPDAVGFGGVSKVYGETDIGGLRVLAKVSIGSSRRRRATPRSLRMTTAAPSP